MSGSEKAFLCGGKADLKQTRAMLSDLYFSEEIEAAIESMQSSDPQSWGESMEMEYAESVLLSRLRIAPSFDMIETRVMSAAIEGTNINATKQWKVARAAVKTEAKKMKAAISAGNLEDAAAAADAAADRMGDFVKELDNLPQSLASHVIIEIFLALAWHAISLGIAKGVGKIVGNAAGKATGNLVNRLGRTVDPTGEAGELFDVVADFGSFMGGAAIGSAAKASVKKWLNLIGAFGAIFTSAPILGKMIENILDGGDPGDEQNYNDCNLLLKAFKADAGRLQKKYIEKAAQLRQN